TCPGAFDNRKLRCSRVSWLMALPSPGNGWRPGLLHPSVWRESTLGVEDKRTLQQRSVAVDGKIAFSAGSCLHKQNISCPKVFPGHTR
ncbi:unnamed protein product, partial [Ectocarpus sp. 4 AP-2014]